MNAITPVKLETPEQRFNRLKAERLAAIAELQDKLGNLASELASEPYNASITKRTAVEYAWLEATDAAYHVWPDVDGLADERQMWLEELGLNEEGYQLTDAGDVRWHDDKGYVLIADRVVTSRMQGGVS